jgi:hypothetical protein
MPAYANKVGKVPLFLLTNRNDLSADVQLGPDAISDIHKFTTNKPQRETGTVAQTQAEQPRLQFETGGQRRIFGQKGPNLKVRFMQFGDKVSECDPVAYQTHQNFGKIDARYAGRIDNFGDNWGAEFIEQVCRQRRSIQNSHSRSAS